MGVGWDASARLGIPILSIPKQCEYNGSAMFMYCTKEFKGIQEEPETHLSS